jgi:hypothetical protein
MPFLVSWMESAPIVLFFVDKDIDDILRTKVRSEHVVYSKGYELENDLFAAGDLETAAASPRRLTARWHGPPLSPNTSDWRCAATEHWAAWVTMCLFGALLRSRAAATYRLASTIHTGIRGKRNPLCRSEAAVASQEVDT